MKATFIILAIVIITLLFYSLQYVVPNANLWLVIALIGSFACLIFKTANQ